MDDLFDDDIFAPAPRRRKRNDDFLDDLFGEPSPSDLRAQQAEERRTVSPEEEQSILGKAGDVALSGMGWFGEVFDKYTGDRALRGLLAGKPRELLSLIPFSDDLGITDHNDLTTGKDLTGWDDKESWWDDIAGGALEIGLGLVNPTNWVGAAAEALTDAGKVAKATGLYDNMVRVAGKKETRLASQAGRAARQVGGFEAQMTTTLRDLLDDIAEEGGKEAADVAHGTARHAAEKAGKHFDDLLDQPLGHRLSFQPPFMESMGPLPGFGAGDELGQAAARWSDTIADGIFGELPDWVPGFGGMSPMKGLRSIFDSSVDDAVTGTAQNAISPRSLEAWKAESGHTLDALELGKMAQDAGLDKDYLMHAAEGSGPFFDPRLRGIDPAAAEAYQMHSGTFGAKGAKLRYGARPGAYGLDATIADALARGDDAAIEAIDDFRRSAGTYDDYQKLRQLVPTAPALTATDFADRTKQMLDAMGDYGKAFPAVVSDALLKDLPVTPEALASAEAILPGKIGQRKFGIGPEYDKLKQDHPEIYDALKRGHAAKQREIANAWKEGAIVPPASDAEMLHYAPRFASFMGGASADILRDVDYKHFPGGTPALRKMLADVAKQSQGDVVKARNLLEGNYSSDITQQVQNQARQEGRLALAGDELDAAVQDRTRKLAESISGLPQKTREVGVFGNDFPLDDLTHNKLATGRITMLKAAGDALVAHFQPLLDLKATKDGNLSFKNLPILPEGEGVSIAQVFDNLKMVPGTAGDTSGGALHAFYRRLGLQAPADPAKFDASARALLEAHIPKDLATDIQRLHKGIEIPQNIENLIGVFDDFTRIFKNFTLAHPATKVRDFYAGQLNSAILGNWSGEAASETMSLLQGGTSTYWAKLKPVQEILERQGINPQAATAAQATEAARTLAGSMDALMQGQTSEVARQGGEVLSEVLDARPGAVPKSLGGMMTDAFSQGSGNWWNDLFTVEGAFGAETTRNPVVRASNYAGDWTDKLNRYIPFFSLLEQGYSPAAAQSRVMLQQIDYSSRALGKLEQSTLARLFPFYKFTRGMAKQLVQELWERPRGRMATVLKGQAIMARQDDGDFIPSHIRQTMAIPLPGGSETNQPFLTGLGLMHEDPFNMIRPGVNLFDTVQGALQELGGRAHPFIKAPAEIATGTQLYSGRDLRDLEGGLGRALSNVAGMDRAVETPILLEQALAMSPFSRGVSTIRTAFDPRKDIYQKLINLGTGARIETVDMEKVKQVELRKLVEEMLRGRPGISAFEHLYQHPDAVLSPEDDALMRFYRKGAYEQMQKKRPRKQQRDEVEELLGI